LFLASYRAEPRICSRTAAKSRAWKSTLPPLLPSSSGTSRGSGIEALPSTRLYEAYFEKQGDEKRVSLKFGQLAADSEFFSTKYTDVFTLGMTAGRRSCRRQKTRTAERVVSQKSGFTDYAQRPPALWRRPFG
jgi:hypothetical protein